MAMDVEEYRELIEYLARAKIDQRIPNGVPQHASVLLEAMLRHAKRDVRIYSGELHESTYGDPGILKAAECFLSKTGARLRILVQKGLSTDQVSSHPLLGGIRKPCEGSIEVRNAKGIYGTDRANHFAVMDDTAYRFELDHTEVQAVANFNEPGVATRLINVFDRAFGMGRPISI